MQVKGLKPPHNYQGFLDVDICITQQFSPKAQRNASPSIHAQSQQFFNNYRNQYNLRQAIQHQLLFDEQENQRSQKRKVFSRQSYSALSKKQTNIRKNNYHQSANKQPSKRDQFEGNHLQIKEATITRAESAQPKRPVSNCSSRTLRSSSIKQYSQKLWISRPQTSNRPLTTASKLSKIQVVQNTQKYFQFRKQNPLVIYPFENHLRIKRIDENPKILGNILTKKSKLMDKQQLYQYVSKIMDRRAK